MAACSFVSSYVQPVHTATRALRIPFMKEKKPVEVGKEARRRPWTELELLPHFVMQDDCPLPLSAFEASLIGGPFTGPIITVPPDKTWN